MVPAARRVYLAADGAPVTQSKVAEVAALAVYLAGDESRFTTGTASLVDGGWTL